MEVSTDTIEAGDGTELFLRRWTPEPPSAASAAKAEMLIVHGLGEHSGRWDHVGRFFADRGYAVTALDLRGHGRSGGRRSHVDAFQDMVDDLATVADALGRDRPWVLYGHSLGGLIATHYLTSDYRQPDAAVLSAPALDDDLPGALRLAARALGRVTPTLSLANSIRGDQLSRDPAVGDTYFADPLVQTRATCRFGMEGFAAQDTVRGRLDAIRVPVLVIHGADDTLVPPRASAHLAAVNGIDRRLYPGLRHEMHNEPEWDQVLSDVAAWMEKTLA